MGWFLKSHAKSRKHLRPSFITLFCGYIYLYDSTFSLEKGEELCRKRKPNEAAPYLMKAIELDKNNLDAYIEIAFILDMEGAVETLETAELRGNSNLSGPNLRTSSFLYRPTDPKTRTWNRLLQG